MFEPTVLGLREPMPELGAMVGIGVKVVMIHLTFKYSRPKD
jgi:hypothetical protein